MLRFEKLTQSEYESYLAEAVAGYAAEHVRGGRWTAEEALEASRAEYASLLPDGLASVDHFLQSIVTSGHEERVGLIWYWLDRKRQRVVLYDLLIYEPYRRQGYATAAMALPEAEAAALSAGHIVLHVFGHNLAARALYEKMGFEITNIGMRKRLS